VSLQYQSIVSGHFPIMSIYFIFFQLFYLMFFIPLMKDIFVKQFIIALFYTTLINFLIYVKLLKWYII